MDDEETILFGGPTVPAAVPPPQNLKSALLGNNKPLVASKKLESPFLNLGAPVGVASTTAAPPRAAKARIKYSREQQELAQDFSSGFKSSPPRQGSGFPGPSSWESKRSYSPHGSIEEPLSSFISRPNAEQAAATGETLTFGRAPSWREPYKPPPGAGPVRSALVDGVPGMAETSAAQAHHSGRRANEDRDGWGNRGSRRDNTSDRGATGGRGGPGGVIRQDRNRANPADSAVAPSGGHGKGSNESGSRWDTKKEEHWRSGGQQGYGRNQAATSREWKDKGARDDKDQSRQDGSKWGDGKPAAGKQAITIDDIEAEKARFRAEWAHEKARGGSDSQADQTEQGDLLMEGDKPQLQQEVNLESIFGDAITGSPAASPVAEDSKSSRFARWFSLEDGAHGAANNAPPPSPAPHPPPPAFSFESLQQAADARVSNGSDGLPAALSGLGQAGHINMPPMPKMPARFKTLEELEEGIMASKPGGQPLVRPPQAPAPKEHAHAGNLLSLLQAGAAKEQPPVHQHATANEWAMATAKLTGAPALKQPQAKQGPSQPQKQKPSGELEQVSQLSSLLQGLGIPTKPVAPPNAITTGAASGMPGASPAAAEARGASRGLQRQGPPPPGSGPDAPSLHAPLGMDQQQGMPRPPPGFHISGPPPPGMQHQMHGMMQQGQMQMPPTNMQPLPHHMASSGHVQLPTGWPRSHMLPPGMPMLGMQYGLPPGHMHPRMPAATPMHMMPPHMMIHPMQPAAGGVVMASAPPPHDAGALARFFDLSTISNAGPLPAMPSIDPAAKKQTLEELERTLQLS